MSHTIYLYIYIYKFIKKINNDIKNSVVSNPTLHKADLRSYSERKHMIICEEIHQWKNTHNKNKHFLRLVSYYTHLLFKLGSNCSIKIYLKIILSAFWQIINTVIKINSINSIYSNTKYKIDKIKILSCIFRLYIKQSFCQHTSI